MKDVLQLHNSYRFFLLWKRFGKWNAGGTLRGCGATTWHWKVRTMAKKEQRHELGSQGGRSLSLCSSFASPINWRSLMTSRKLSTADHPQVHSTIANPNVTCLLHLFSIQCQECHHSRPEGEELIKLSAVREPIWLWLIMSSCSKASLLQKGLISWHVWASPVTFSHNQWTCNCTIGQMDCETDAYTADRNEPWNGNDSIAP
jgi:hypothetical protein